MEPESRRPGATIEAELRHLSRPEPPPAALEDRVVSQLTSRGLLRARGAGRRYLRASMAAAAAIAIFAAGTIVGARRDGVADGPRYALLLLGGPGYSAPSGAEADAVVDHYRVWAGRLREHRALLVAEKLGGTVAVVPATGSAGAEQPELLGIFIVVAASDAEAEAIAAASPHAARGGRVAVVRIDPT